ncbi:hypothetical protein [Candidatus Enterovibrio altilux]|uniref:hypothetical protein n=1 Tax=Candidatus Enterovibrio altilux TaxID=1927128 RepID=UPI0012380666
MFRVKKLPVGILILRDCNAQIDKIYAMIKALNKLTELGDIQNKSEYLIVSHFGICHLHSNQE